MKEYKINKPCPVCKGQIVANVSFTSKTDPMFIPIGPASKNYYRKTIKSIWCQDCCIEFSSLSKIGGEIWQQIKIEEEAEAQVKREKDQKYIKSVLEKAFYSCRICGAADKNKCNCVGYEG